ncbi:hypothetical protein PAPYR_2459 [Paratrimastix pyriformis]|uniref:Uncharacterized protein n=1 Tax=Paratrimastix pyriformis TaxID=342808 RepID=A0ABQ8UPB6_9EUKA|nr:hypothetical protein PAPYR_2459 [Paratrimastix pyriformis]
MPKPMADPCSMSLDILPSDVMVVILECTVPSHRLLTYCQLLALNHRIRERLLGVLRQIDFAAAAAIPIDQQLPLPPLTALLSVETVTSLVGPCCHLDSLNLATEMTGCLREDAGWVDIAFPATRTPTLRSLVVDCTAGLGRCALARILDRVAPSLEDLTVTLDDIDWLNEILPRLPNLRALSLHGCPVDCSQLVPCAARLAELTLDISTKTVRTINVLLPRLASLERFALTRGRSTPVYTAGPRDLPPIDFGLLPDPARLRHVAVAEWLQPPSYVASLAAVCGHLVTAKVSTSCPEELITAHLNTLEEIHLRDPNLPTVSGLINRAPELRVLSGFPHLPDLSVLRRLTVLEMKLSTTNKAKRFHLAGCPFLRRFHLNGYFERRRCVVTLDDMPALEHAAIDLMNQKLTLFRCPHLQHLSTAYGVELETDGPLESLTSLLLHRVDELHMTPFNLHRILAQTPNLVTLDGAVVSTSTQCQDLFRALPRLAEARLRSATEKSEVAPRHRAVAPVVAPVLEIAAPPGLRLLTLNAPGRVVITGDGLVSVLAQTCASLTVRSPRLRTLAVNGDQTSLISLATPNLGILSIVQFPKGFRIVEETPLVALHTMRLDVGIRTLEDTHADLMRQPFVARLKRLIFRCGYPTKTEVLLGLLTIPPVTVALDLTLSLATSTQAKFPALPNLRTLTLDNNSAFVLYGRRAGALEAVNILGRNNCSVRVPRDAPCLTRIGEGTCAKRTRVWLQQRCPLIMAGPDP